MAGLPERDGTGHGHENLDERAGDEPDALLRPHAVPDPPYERTGVERDERAQSLLICLVECVISRTRCAFEEPGDGDCELVGVFMIIKLLKNKKKLMEMPSYLSKVASLEPTPDENR